MADPLRDWMWSEACDMLARAERLHRAFVRPARSREQMPALPVWEPPADILETDEEVVVIIALPGVEAERAEVTIDGNDLVVEGVRVLPSELRHASIHRLELPQGRFERRLPLPAGTFRDISRAAAAGCLVITLRKTGAGHG